MINVSSKRTAYFYLAAFTTLLALAVIMLGAYTRLKESGLGCPDWPACYGHVTMPYTTSQIEQLHPYCSHAQVESQKVWLEMLHRNFAGTFGFLILILTIWAMARKFNGEQQNLVVPLLLCAAVIFKTILSKWTVTVQFLPLVVTVHLLGSMLIIALLWALVLSSGNFFRQQPTIIYSLRPWAILGLTIVALQIFLGGWTGSHYAALVCHNFPTCEGSFFPVMDFKSAFNFFNPLGQNYAGGDLENAARVAIQMTHRYGAFITAFYVSMLALYLIIARNTRGYRGLGWTLLIILGIQFSLGVLNVEWLLPLSVAVAHNGVAALLLLTLVTLIYRLYVKRTNRIEFN